MVLQNSFFKDDDFGQEPIKKFLKPYYLTSTENKSIYYYIQIS